MLKIAWITIVVFAAWKELWNCHTQMFNLVFYAAVNKQITDEI